MTITLNNSPSSVGRWNNTSTADLWTVSLRLLNGPLLLAGKKKIWSEIQFVLLSLDSLRLSLHCELFIYRTQSHQTKTWKDWCLNHYNYQSDIHVITLYGWTQTGCQGWLIVMGYSRKNPHPPDGWGPFLTPPLTWISWSTRPPLPTGFPRWKTPPPAWISGKKIKGLNLIYF